MVRVVLALLILLVAACKSKKSGPTEPNCSITGVSVTQAQFTMTVGQAVDVQAAIAQSGCTDLPDLTFTSSDPDVVSVSGTGTVTAVAVGTARVTVGIQGRSEQVTVDVTVDGRVLSLTLTPDSTGVLVTGTVQLTAALSVDPGMPTGLDWTSSNPSVATVSGTGVVTGVGPGSVLITVRAQADPTKVASAKVAVFPRVTGVAIDPVLDTILVVEALPINATVSGDPGIVTTVTWRSSDPAIATVATNPAGNAGGGTATAFGLITGVAAGTAEITAISTADTTRRATATIVVLPRVFGITVTPPTATVNVSATQALVATITGDPGVSVEATWSTSDASRATVSATGVVTGVAVGTAVITARAVADPSKSATATITVVSAPQPPPPVSTSDLCIGATDPDAGGGESPPAAPGVRPAFLLSPPCPTEVALDLVPGRNLPIWTWLASVGINPPVASTATVGNGAVAALHPDGPGAWTLEALAAGTTTIDFTKSGVPALTARVNLRVTTTPQVTCVALTPSGPCASNLTIPVGQSRTLYSRNQSGQATPALWNFLPPTGPIESIPSFFDTRAVVKGVTPGIGIVVMVWTGGGTGTALPVTVVP